MFTEHRVRPTSGTEFVYSRHFPDEMQGDFLINNTIGFLGTKQHAVREDGSGFRGTHRADLVRSTDGNFRPVDLEFAPDGSLYLIDWHNPLIGHMQHNARDPNRDHEHGRIYRVTYPARPLVPPAKIVGEPIPALLELLTVPEQQTRHRVLRELRGRSAGEVLPAVRHWVDQLDSAQPEYERHLLMALWVTWGQHQIDETLLERALTADAHQLRAAAVEVIRHDFRQLPDPVAQLKRAAADPHGRVRLAAMVAASWIGGRGGAEVVWEALRHPLDHWMENVGWYAAIPLKAELAALAGVGGAAGPPLVPQLLEHDFDFATLPKPAADAVPSEVRRRLGSAGVEAWTLGREVYFRDGHCSTCHQPAGEGVEKIYPPLDRSEWLHDETRLVKLVLHGLTGDITVKGERYYEATTPPMPGFAGLLNDGEIAALVTYVRNAFGPPVPVTPVEKIQQVRQATTGQTTFYRVEDLLREHPMP
jgi:mono/diheme cytochrome c family protein